MQSAHISSLRRYLRSIRQPYLSTTQPLRRTDLSRSGTYLANGTRQYFTDSQRDQIDAESKQLLRDMNTAIQNLANAEQLRQRAEAILAQRRRGGGVGFNVLKAWAAGSSAAGSARTPLEEIEEARANTVKLHRESVLWFLRRQLEACSELQMTMMETRLVREMEKGKSRLYSARGITAPQISTTHFDHVPISGKADGPSPRSVMNDKLSAYSAEEAGLPVTSEQLQLFAEENQSMLKHYEDTLDQVRFVEMNPLSRDPADNPSERQSGL